MTSLSASTALVNRTISLPQGLLNRRKRAASRLAYAARPPVLESEVEQKTGALEVLGRYELVRRVGTGATAEVFEARRIGKFGIEARVALKKLMPELCSDNRFLNMFVREARVYSRLNHPNILQIQDFDEIGGQYFIVTDFVDGLDLDELVTRTKDSGLEIPPSVVADIMRQVLRGLDHAHRTTDERGHNINLMHRDIKPSNILVSWEGVVKLGDFGVARTDASAYQSVDGRFLKGTLRYMSPEHVRLQKVVQASDLFSAGLVMYELIRQEPFVSSSASIPEIIARLAHDARDPLLDALPAAHQCFRNVLDLALQPDTISRYGTAAEFLDDLNALEHLIPPGPDARTFLQTNRGRCERAHEEAAA